MPKLKESPIARANAAFRAHLGRHIGYYGTNTDEISKRIRVSRATLNGRRRTPGMLRMDEFRRLIQVCNWGVDEVCEIVGIENQYKKKEKRDVA